MKKHAIVLLICLLIPVLLYPVSDKKVTITKLTLKPLPFNEKRDSAIDSPYNAFDGDIKTSALYSDFTLEFNEPVSMNEIRIINGSAGNKNLFKKNNRLRDIEITLYTIDTPPEKKVHKTKVRKKKASKPLKKTEPEKKILKPDNKEKIKNDKLINISCNTDKNENRLLFIALKDENKIEDTTSPKTIDKKNTENKIDEKSSKTLKSKKNKVPVKTNSQALKTDNKKNKSGITKPVEKIDIRDTVKPDTKKSKVTKQQKQKKTENLNRQKDKNISDKKKPVSPLKKKDSKKPEVKKNVITKKQPAKKKTDKKPGKEIPYKKMTGIYRPENDKEGKIFVYYSLKDITTPQNIKLKKYYKVTKIDFRTRDNEHFTGTDHYRTCLTEISFYNKGRKIPIAGIDEMKKKYVEKYNTRLMNSISGSTFLLYEQNDIIMRMIFHKNGKIEFIDRYKCRNQNDKDCTSLSFPDRWRIRNGKLYMRYQEIWMLWKYELDLHDDFMDDKISEADSPRYLKIYYKKEKDFSEKFLFLQQNTENILSGE